MSIKSIIQSALAPTGLELHRRPDPTLPLLNEFETDGRQHRLWLTNPFTKSWWHKPHIPLNGELSELKRLCSDGAVVLKIGAHHGLMTLLMAGWVGASGHIHAIEASADNALVLDANCFQNKLFNVTTTFTAIGSQPGTVSFGGESLAAASGIVREVPMITADHHCVQHGISSVEVLKIDVEGYEMGVLQGATELLKTRPKLSLELHIDLLPDAGSSAKEVWNFLQQNDMFKDRPITMLCRPDWDKVQSINSFQDLPGSGVVNLFVG